MMAHNLVEVECLACRTPFVYADWGRPEAGDVSICCNCGALALFETPCVMRIPTPSEANRMAMDPRICHAIRGLGFTEVAN